MVEISKGGWLIAIDLPGWNTQASRSERWMNNATDGSTCGTLGIPIEKFPMHFAVHERNALIYRSRCVFRYRSQYARICTWFTDGAKKPEKYLASMLQQIPFQPRNHFKCKSKNSLKFLKNKQNESSKRQKFIIQIIKFPNIVYPLLA